MSDKLEVYNTILSHLSWSVKNNSSSFIGCYLRPESIQPLIHGVIALAEELESCDVKYTFNTACEMFYRRSGVLLDIMQRPHAMPDGVMPFIEIPVEKYTKFYFDYGPSNTVIDNY